MKKDIRTTLNAGRFSTRLRNISVSLLEIRSIVVPCGDCNVCCRYSQFIHITPNEARTLKRVPKELLFPAPLLRKGYMVLGYDEHGRCPMFIRNECSIYRNHPATCRSFDCRILAASGIKVIEENYYLVVKQAQRWQFSYSDDYYYILHSAVKTAAAFPPAHRDSFPAKWVQRKSIQLAFLSIIDCDVFLNTNALRSDIKQVQRNSNITKKVLMVYEKFESRKRSDIYFFI